MLAPINISMKYVQLDIPVKEIPANDDVYNYIITNTYNKNPDVSNGIICIVGSKKNLTDFRTTLDIYSGVICGEENKETFEEHQDTLYRAINDTNNIGEFYYEPVFAKKFPQLVEAVEQFPFKYKTAVFLMLAGSKGSPIHQDPVLHSFDPSIKNTVVPDRFNIQLSYFENARFYICDKEGNDKTYIRVTREYPCFAFDNQNYHHGADVPIENEIRMQVLVFGLLDNEKHKELINRSLEKWKDK